MSSSIKRLTDLFSKFPTIGSRTAGRFVFYLINQDKKEVDELISAIQSLKNNIKFCAFCFNPFESTNVPASLCSLCQDPARNHQVLCVVEKENDLISLEHTGRYKGLYFIMSNTLVTLKKISGGGIRLEQLKERLLHPETFGIAKTPLSEIIIATNPTPEGKTISILIERALKEILLPSSIKITHLAKGLPIGGELEYADDETLESAFEGRK